MLAETPLEQAKIAMEKLRKVVEESPFHFRGERVVINQDRGNEKLNEGDDRAKRRRSDREEKEDKRRRKYGG